MTDIIKWLSDERRSISVPGGMAVDYHLPHDEERLRAKLDAPMPHMLLDMLADMMDRQLRFQSRLDAGDPRALTGEERVAYIRNMILALEDELHEALGEVGWKPWATSRHVNEAAFKSELIDALHFLLNLFLVAGMTPAEVYSLYVAKNNKNHRRQDDGYDGVSGKCPKCKRAYDDAGVACYPPSEPGSIGPGHSGRGYCAKADDPAEAFYA